MTSSYSAKDIRVLEEVEHIQLNPGMYVGETSNPVHLIEEVLDNALDEALGGHAKIIAVLIDTKKNVFSVLDDGRGIPISKDTPIVISSKLFSGAKFQDKKTAYEISSGLHGVGLVAVNALSSYYKVEVYRGKQDFKGKAPFSTKIEFTPNKKYFETIQPDLKRIRKRLTTASAEMPNDIQFALVIDDTKEVFQLDEVTHFVNSCLTEAGNLVATTLDYEKKPERFRVLFTYEDKGPITPKIISSINLLPVDNGGTHFNCLADLFRDFFFAKGKKYGYKFQANDSLFKLRAYLMLKMINPKFSSQTKDKLTNRKTDFDKFMKEFRNQLEAFANDNEDTLKKYLGKFQDYRRVLDAQKMKTNGTGGRRASTQFTKLRDCTSRDGELYIVEGESAGGSIIQCRDPRMHAVLPLKGKSIPNVTTKKNILDNKEVGELVRAIGTGIPPQFDLSKMRYQKIITATDADHDGNHIACLVSMVIAILLPEVIRDGRYFIAQTPLFAINEGKTFIPIWDDKQLEKARDKGRKITRFKGLGELSPHQLKVCLIDEKTRNLIPVSYSENIQELIKLFSSANEKRRLLE
jgi:DNA gyrase/topoisomerase IV subunit B